jgi:hypothetical protein
MYFIELHLVHTTVVTVSAELDNNCEIVAIGRRVVARLGSAYR